MTDNLFADISSNNASFAAKPYAAAGHLAIAIKATEGTGYTNPKYAGWVSDAHRHHLAVFHYHFARPESGDPRGQADHFWHICKPHFKRPGDYVVVDVETGSPKAGKTFTLAFDKELKKLSSTRPVLYTFQSYLNEGDLTISSDRVWLAAWGRDQPGKNWNLPGPETLWAWQYSDGVSGPMPHSFAGIPGTCDGSKLNPKTTASLRSQLRH